MVCGRWHCLPWTRRWTTINDLSRIQRNVRYRHSTQPSQRRHLRPLTPRLSRRFSNNCSPNNPTSRTRRITTSSSTTTTQPCQICAGAPSSGSLRCAREVRHRSAPLANRRRAGHAHARQTAQINPIDIRRHRRHRPTAAAATPAAASGGTRHYSPDTTHTPGPPGVWLFWAPWRWSTGGDA